MRNYESRNELKNLVLSLVVGGLVVASLYSSTMYNLETEVNNSQLAMITSPYASSDMLAGFFADNSVLGVVAQGNLILNTKLL